MESNKLEVTYFKHLVYQDYACDNNGNIYSLKFGKIKSISPYETKNGYLRFNIWQDGKLAKRFLIHRFIWECHYNEILDKNIDVDHIDRNKLNNSIDNLRKVNRTTNILNRFNNEEVDELPDDKIEVIKYNNNYFENLYFSPSTNCLYKISDGYIFKIPFKYQGSIQIYNINKNKVQICLNKLREILDCN